MGPGDLAEILRDFPTFDHPCILVSGKLEDAGVYQLGPEVALVQTVDFFTPVVDDPYLFGQIAAANALSDIYAMGARPLTALNIAAFPVCALEKEVLREILRGGAEKVKEAGAVMLGGHTVEAQELKYGLAVTGIVHPQEILRKQGGKPGDLLLLTKPLGTGIITTALKLGEAPREAVEEAARQMCRLNNLELEAMRGKKVHACTDITGFGFLGHLYEMIADTQEGAELDFAAFPFLPEAPALAEAGFVPAGAYRNRSYLEGKVLFEEGIREEEQDLLFDPQTSGGLLLAFPPEEKEALLAALAARGVKASVVGRLTAAHPGKILVRRGS